MGDFRRELVTGYPEPCSYEVKERESILSRLFSEGETEGLNIEPLRGRFSTEGMRGWSKRILVEGFI